MNSKLQQILISGLKPHMKPEGKKQTHASASLKIP